MLYLLKHIQAQVMTIGFFIIAVFAVPAFVNAQVSPADNVSLKEEQLFLHTFEAQHSDIIHNAAWRKIGDQEIYALDLLTAKPRGLKFIMQQQASNDDQWNLYVQEMRAGKWVYKYNKHPIGYQKNIGHEKEAFVYYLTASNIAQVLTQKKIAFINDVQAELAGHADPQKNRALDPIETLFQTPQKIAGALCQEAMLRAHNQGDTNKWIDHIYAPYTTQEMKILRDDAYGYDALSMAIDPQARMKDEVLQARALQTLSKDSLQSALSTTIYHTMTFLDYFQGPKTPSQWMSFFRQNPNISNDVKTNTAFINTLPETVKSFAANDRVVYLSHQARVQALDQINRLHHDIQKNICEPAAQDYQNSPASMGHISYGSQDGSAGRNATDAMIRSYNQDNAAMRRKLLTKYENIVMPQIEVTIASNPLQSLFMTSIFQKASAFDVETCFKKGQSGLRSDLTIADVNQAIQQGQRSLLAALEDRIQEQRKNKKEVLKTYIQSYPNVLAQLYKQKTKNTDQDWAELSVACALIDDMYTDQEIEVYMDYGFMGVAVIAGIATGGSSLPITLAVMGAITATEAIEAGLDWFDGYLVTEHARKGFLAGQNTFEAAKSARQFGETLQSRAKMDFGLTLAAYGVGDVLAESYRAGKLPVWKKIAQETPSISAPAKSVRVIGAVDDTAPVLRQLPPPSKPAPSLGDLKIAAGGKYPLLDEYQNVQKIIESKYGQGYKVLMAKDGEVITAGPSGQLEKFFLHKGEAHLEEMRYAFQSGNTSWNLYQNGVVKTVYLPNGQTVTLERSVQKTQDPLFLAHDYQKEIIDNHTIVRADKNVYLKIDDNKFIQGKRVEEYISFEGQHTHLQLPMAESPLLHLEDARWGDTPPWRYVRGDRVSNDVSQFDLPSYKRDGIVTGFGDINCSGHSFSCDAYLAGGHHSNTLSDQAFNDFFKTNLNLEEVVGKSPTITPQNAAKHYGSQVDSFTDLEKLNERLMGLQDRGTVLVYVKNQDGSAHVFNARKEGKKIVYYDWQKRTVYTNTQDAFFHHQNGTIDIVETTAFHKRVASGLEKSVFPSTQVNQKYTQKFSDFLEKTLDLSPQGLHLFFEPRAFLYYQEEFIKRLYGSSHKNSIIAMLQKEGSTHAAIQVQIKPLSLDEIRYFIQRTVDQPIENVDAYFKAVLDNRAHIQHGITQASTAKQLHLSFLAHARPQTDQSKKIIQSVLGHTQIIDMNTVKLLPQSNKTFLVEFKQNGRLYDYAPKALKAQGSSQGSATKIQELAAGLEESTSMRPVYSDTGQNYIALYDDVVQTQDDTYVFLATHEGSGDQKLFKLIQSDATTMPSVQEVSLTLSQQSAEVSPTLAKLQQSHFDFSDLDENEMATLKRWVHTDQQLQTQRFYFQRQLPDQEFQQLKHAFEQGQAQGSLSDELIVASTNRNALDANPTDAVMFVIDTKHYAQFEPNTGLFSIDTHMLHHPEGLMIQRIEAYDGVEHVFLKPRTPNDPHFISPPTLKPAGSRKPASSTYSLNNPSLQPNGRLPFDLPAIEAHQQNIQRHPINLYDDQPIGGLALKFQDTRDELFVVDMNMKEEMLRLDIPLEEHHPSMFELSSLSNPDLKALTANADLALSKHGYNPDLGIEQFKTPQQRERFYKRLADHIYYSYDIEKLGNVRGFNYGDQRMTHDGEISKTFVEALVEGLSVCRDQTAFFELVSKRYGLPVSQLHYHSAPLSESFSFRKDFQFGHIVAYDPTLQKVIDLNGDRTQSIIFDRAVFDNVMEETLPLDQTLSYGKLSLFEIVPEAK